MEAISIALILLLAVVASSVLTRMSPLSLPLPLVQIALGALIDFAFDFQIVLEPEIFFLLFIAPLLFLDGWQISRQGLARDKWTILALALGLVVFTVLGAGYFIHWIIPGIPLPVAFALAAILSPTDAVAVSTLAERAPIPRRLLHILQGESLLNDASGLVCMRFAVAAMLTGAFSVGEALRSFALLAVAGLAVGAAVALLATIGKDWISRRYGEVTGSQILISLLIPFGAYLLAVRIDASGILAAVSAGLVMNREEQSGRVLAVTRLRRSAVWEAMHFAGSGMVFVLLGEQLPEIFEGAARVVSETGHQRELWLLGYVLAITLALATLRFLWVWATLDLVLFRRLGEGERNDGPSWRLIAATSLAGVRGAITLAGVLTLPLTLLDGTAFPARDLAILLAAGVIVVSILAAQIGLPYLMRGLKLPAESAPQKQEDLARAVAAEAAAKAVERALRRIANEGQDAPLHLDAGSRIIASYQQRIEARNRTGEEVEVARRRDEVERSLRLVALEAERNELYRMARTGQLADELAHKLVREIDLQESWFVGR